MSRIVRMTNSTAVLASNKQSALINPLKHPKIHPLTIFNRLIDLPTARDEIAINPNPALSIMTDVLLIEMSNSLETTRINATIPNWMLIQTKNGSFENMSSNSCKLWLGSSRAPNPAIKPAPTLTSKLPNKLSVVNPSWRSKLARIALKINPLACNGARITRGRVVIWTALPRMFDVRKIIRPSRQSPRRKGRRRW